MLVMTLAFFVKNAAIFCFHALLPFIRFDRVQKTAEMETQVS